MQETFATKKYDCFEGSTLTQRSVMKQSLTFQVPWEEINISKLMSDITYKAFGIGRQLEWRNITRNISAHC